MESLKFKVTETDIELLARPSKITAGNINILKCEFELDGGFDELLVRASFNGKYREVIDGVCYAPLLEQGFCRIGVYGYRLNSDNGYECVLSPEPTSFYVNDGSFNKNEVSAANPAPSELEDYIRYVNKALAAKQNALLAGDNIALEDNDDGTVTISAQNGVDIEALLAEKQDVFTTDSNLELSVNEDGKLELKLIFAQFDDETLEFDDSTKAINGEQLLFLGKSIGAIIDRFSDSIRSSLNNKCDNFIAGDGLIFTMKAGKSYLNIANLDSYAHKSEVEAVDDTLDDDSISSEVVFLSSRYIHQCKTKAVSSLYIDPSCMTEKGTSTLVFTTASEGDININIADIYPLYWHGDMPTFENGKTYELNFVYREIFDEATGTSKGIIIGAGGAVEEIKAVTADE